MRDFNLFAIFRFLFFLAVPSFLTGIAHAQNIIFYEDFEDGDLTRNPAWSGNDDDFVIVSENGNHMLRLDGSDSGGIAQLTTKNNSAFGTWEFFIRLDNFVLSDNNRAFVFLTADRKDLSGTVNGYALRTGESGSPKHFRIVRFDNGSQETVLSATTELESGDYRIKVTREENGAWNLYASEGFDSIPLIENKSVIDNTHLESGYFGIKIHYTATRRDRFFFDEMSVRDYIDSLQAADVQVITSRKIRVIFTDRIDESGLQPAHFIVNDILIPGSTILVEDNVVELEFDEQLKNGSYELVINEIRDDRGRMIGDNSSLKFEVINPFQVEKVIARSGSSIDVFFSEAVDPVSLDNVKFSVDGSHPTTAGIHSDTDSIVRLSYDPPLNSGEYQLVITDILSPSGWEIAEQILPFTWFLFQIPDERDVVINEFLYRNLDGGPQRFLELYNRSDKNFDLNHWQFGRGTGSALTLTGTELPDGSVSPVPLLKGEYLVLASDASSLPEVSGHIIEISPFPGFSRFGDAIYIRDGQGNRIDSLYYQPEWGGNEDGHSLQRVNPGGASNDPFNWTGSSDVSAGIQNKSFMPDTIPPEITFTTFTDDGDILVRLNKFIKDKPETNFFIESGALKVIEFDPFNSNTLLLAYDGDINQDTDIYLEARDLVDFSRNKNKNTIHPIARPMHYGDVVINEIMYRPRTDRYSELADQSEYVELFNRRNYAVSLEGIFLHDRPDRNDQVAKREPVKTTEGWIPARQYAVVYADTAQIFENTRLFESFNPERTELFFRVDRNSLGLAVGGDEVYLANRDGTVIDSVFYHDTWHNPNLIDTRGISLERINPDAAGNDSRNWTSNTNIKGGSPGFQNTVYATPGHVQLSEGLMLEPNPFSPDGRGVDDYLFINYALDEPDYLMRIRIFDRYGRMVRTLADGEVAGLNGHVLWDGRKDDQSDNRIGIYIILFEAYNSSRGTNKTFREIVVLARNL